MEKLNRCLLIYYYLYVVLLYITMFFSNFTLLVHLVISLSIVEIYRENTHLNEFYTAGSSIVFLLPHLTSMFNIYACVIGHPGGGDPG